MGDKDFFLDPDDAMTMGDINYMRKPTRTRRTFPKTLANKGGFAIENEVSSVEDRSGMFKGNSNDNAGSTVSATPAYTFQPQPAPAPEPAPAPAPAPATESRKSDSSMDMFRNMAKSIRK